MVNPRRQALAAGRHAQSGRDRIRIAHFLNSPGVPGGVEEHVYGIVENLPADRFDVTLICPEACYDYFARLASLHRKVFCLDLYRYSQLGAMKQLADLLRQQEIEIAHSHQFFATLFLAPIAKACRVPFVVETTHIREAWRRGWIKRSYLVDRLIYTLVDRFVAVSLSNMRYLIQEKRCRPDRVVPIYNGRDMSRFISNPLDAERTRREYGISSADLLLVHLGRLAVQKGHTYLFDALPFVQRKINRVKLLLVGDGEMRSALESEVEQRGLGDMVIFAGFQSPVSRFIEAADLVVLPSLFEGLPLVPIEAGAMGKAIVASAVDGVPEVVKDGETGLLVPPKNSQQLADAIVSLLSDEVRRTGMGASGRKFICKTFTVARQVKAQIALYESLIDGTAFAGEPSETASP